MELGRALGREIAEPAHRLLERWQQPLAGAEDHAGFHAAARAHPALTAKAQERQRRFEDRAPGADATVDFHRAVLAAAGFRATGEVWRYLSDAILLAIR